MSARDDGHSPHEASGSETPFCEHLVHFYMEEEVFLDLLEGFIIGSLRARESVVVIATAAHLHALDRRLAAHPLHIGSARAHDRYIPLNAEETLGRFMIGGWPDDERFNDVVREILARARKDDR